MTKKLFESIEIRNLKLKNRIVMSPMCMYSAEDGEVTPWHVTHYASRAVGLVGLVILEATAVKPEGRISVNDLGIWSDKQIEGLKKITSAVKASGAAVGIQLAHAGRKAELPEAIFAPSAIAFDEQSKTPQEMSLA
ncbi:MAG TPA: NADPH dehydrogenase, partial [Enterococcus sp.]|nr:NADPH dehydrogenase [Enterococcus sp.]